MSLLDPWGFWKTARDANLEAWSKFMIDLVNSDEYAQATGVALEQALATSQPLRDAMERSMTQTLSLLNMPSRAEVVSLAERLVNVEMRLDDLDAKVSAVQSSLQRAIKETVREVIPAQASQLKNVTGQIAALETRLDALKNLETQLAQLNSTLGGLRADDTKSELLEPHEPVVKHEVRTGAKSEPAHEAQPKPARTTVPSREPVTKNGSRAKHLQAGTGEAK
jgi:hypothetical protein